MLCTACFHLRCLQHQQAGGWWGRGDTASPKSPGEGALAGTEPCSAAAQLPAQPWLWGCGNGAPERPGHCKQDPALHGAGLGLLFSLTGQFHAGSR